MSNLLGSMHLASKAKPAAPTSSNASSSSTLPHSLPLPTGNSPIPPPKPEVFRSLVFGGSVSVQVNLSLQELPPNANTSVESYYLQAPRVSYLPLLLQQIRKYFLNLIMEEGTATSIPDDQIWFSYNGIPLKWHWPIGLLCDYHTAHSINASSSSTTSSSLATMFSSPASDSTESFRTWQGRSSPFATTSKAAAHRAGPMPWKITLHIKNPPTDSLLLGPSVDACRTCFMNMVKEGDYVRWGSVKRVTNLRREQQDLLWEGVVQNDFDKYWSTASRLIPLPSNALHTSPESTRSPTPSSIHSGGSSLASDARLPESNSMRSVPIRIHLPEGAPVLQEVIPPTIQGVPTTLRSWLSGSLPLFFPTESPALARIVIHGITIPLDAEIAWLGACLLAADGWVSAVLALVQK